MPIQQSSIRTGILCLTCSLVLFLFLAGAVDARAASPDRTLRDSEETVQFQQAGSAEQELADRYAPVVYLRQVNNDICNTENEGFDPVSVDFVLGRDDIPLRTSDSGLSSGPLRTVTDSPTTRDLYGLDHPDFLDFLGSPLRPGCVYRRYYAGRLAAEDVQHVAYAHIYLEPETDELALQYWMFYYFNDWNNNHEGDWEMITLFFDAGSAAEALLQEPTRLVYAQHGGGERADWDDDKLSLEDGRPVVYSARGAHASFYEQRIYLGLVENGTGLGCETTVGPHRRIALDAVVVPHQPSGPDDPFAWLAFNGRWGEFRRSEWNGPTGPNDKTSWTEPVTWADDQRGTSLYVPTFDGFGQAPVDLFCGAISGGSRMLMAFSQTPMLVTGILGAVVVSLGWTYSYSRGTVRQAFGYYRRNFRTFGLIGAALIPTGYVVAGLQTLLFHVPPIDPLLHMMERFPGFRIFLLLMLGGAQTTLAAIFVAPAVIWTMAQMRTGRVPRINESYRAAMPQVVPILIARLKVIWRAILLAVTIVKLPRAILSLVRAIYIPQAVIQKGDEPESAIVTSAQVAGVSMSRTILTQLVLSIITLLTGPVLAVFLLLAIPSRPIEMVNFVSSIIFALIYPLGIIGMTLLYTELRQRAPVQDTPPLPSAAEPEPAN